MMVFVKFKNKFANSGKAIDLGDPKNVKNKEELKMSFIIETILIWILYLFVIFGGTLENTIHQYFLLRKIPIKPPLLMVKNPTSMQKVILEIRKIIYNIRTYEFDSKKWKNIIYIAISSVLLYFSARTVYVSDRLAKNTNSYHNK
jgi:hypothetical protein